MKGLVKWWLPLLLLAVLSVDQSEAREWSKEQQEVLAAIDSLLEAIRKVNFCVTS